MDHILRRRRITALFRHAARARVTLCVAPAGYGKTIASDHFLARRRRTLARLTLSERSEGLFNFVRELAAKLSEVLERPELTFSAVYDRVAVSATPDLDLARWLQSQLPDREVWIILDKLDRCADDPQVVRFLDRIIRECPQLRWFLLARTAGSLPVPNWMADDLLDMPIDHRALAFTSEEAAALAQRCGTAAAGWTIGELVERMHGWPLGISMRLRYADGFGRFAYDRRNGAGAYRSMLDYCYRLCTARERDLLLDTALMQRLHDGAVRELGWRDGLRVLRAMGKRFPHFFDDVGGVLAYGDLARSYLLGRLRDRGADAAAASTLRCGRALEKANRAADALWLYVEQNASDEIGRLLEAHGFALVDSGSTELVNAALSVLPSEAEGTRPVTLALRGEYESRLGRLDVSEAWYLHALNNSSGELHDEIAYRYGCDLLRRQRPDCIPLLEALAERSVKPARIADARSALAQAYFLEERVEDARDAMRRSLDALRTIDDAGVLARTLGRASYVCLYSDDLRGAADFGGRALELAVPARQYVVAIGALSVLYRVACEKGTVDDALAHLAMLAELSRYTGNLDFQLYAVTGAYELYAESCDLAGLARCESALRPFDLHYDTSTTLEALLPARALQCTWRGEFERAYALLAPSASQQRGFEWKAQRHAELALYAAACDHGSDARREVTAAEHAIVQARAGTHMATQAQITLGIAQSLLGDRQDAERWFKAARVDVASFPRLLQLLNAVETLHRRWGGAANHSDLLHALAGLYEAKLGGIARMLEQIPMPVAVRALLRNGAEPDEFASPRFMELVDRYPEVAAG